MLYHLYELNQAALHPARAAAEAYRMMWRNPLNPASHTVVGRGAAAALELFERSTRRYRKPDWEIDRVTAHGMTVPVKPVTLRTKPFCNLVHFQRDLPSAVREDRTPRFCWWRPWRGTSPRCCAEPCGTCCRTTMSM